MSLLDTIASYQLVLQGATTVFARGEARTWLNEELENLFKIGRKATNAAAADYLAQAIEICFNDDGFVIHPEEDGANNLVDLLDSAINASQSRARSRSTRRVCHSACRTFARRSAYQRSSEASHRPRQRDSRCQGRCCGPPGSSRSSETPSFARRQRTDVHGIGFGRLRRRLSHTLTWLNHHSEIRVRSACVLSEHLNDARQVAGRTQKPHFRGYSWI